MPLILLIFIFAAYPSLSITLEDMKNATSINLIWTNFSREEGEGNKYIFPMPYVRQLSNTNKDLIEVVDSVSRIALWAKLNPKIHIYIWYDGQTVSPKQLTNTIEELQKLNISDQVHLINLRDKIAAYEHFIYFFNVKLRKYYRADIFEFLATYIALKEATKSPFFFAYFDFSVNPISLEDLYGYYNTKEKIEKYKVVVENPHSSIRTSFYVMQNDEDLLLALDGVIIKTNLLRVNEALGDDAFDKIREQQVYGDYPTFSSVLDALKQKRTYFHEGRAVKRERTYFVLPKP